VADQTSASIDIASQPFKRKAEKTIIDSALKGLKKRVEG
jgi:ribosomal protein S21